MIKKKYFIALFVVFVLLSVYCEYQSFTPSNLKNLDSVDRIDIFVVDKNRGKRNCYVDFVQIENSEQINQITTSLKVYLDNWQDFGFGPLSSFSGPIQIGFYNQTEFKFGIEIGYKGDKMYIKKPWDQGKYLTTKQFEEILELFQLEKGCAYQDELSLQR